MQVTNLLKVSRATRDDFAQNYGRPLRPAYDSTRGMSSQLSLHGFKFRAADIAEFAQRVVVLGCPGLNFLEGKVGFRIRTNNVVNYPFSARKHGGRGTQAYAA
jgi:hypothetical protein